jgi:hypothetical protein
MTITLGSVDTGTHLHGSIKADPYNFDSVVQPFFGVQGEYHLLGKLHGRELSCWLLLYGFADHNAVQAGVTALNDLILENGQLRVTVGSNVTTGENVVFHGFVPEEDPWLDGSGVNGWQVLGTMKFRQVKS